MRSRSSSDTKRSSSTSKTRGDSRPARASRPVPEVHELQRHAQVALLARRDHCLQVVTLLATDTDLVALHGRRDTLQPELLDELVDRLADLLGDAGLQLHV